MALWNCGGTSAVNYATFLACQDLNTGVCHLDHDDFWSSNHLQTIVDALSFVGKTPFIHTLSKYLHHEYFPTSSPDGAIVQVRPMCGALIHSSVYVDYSIVPFAYRDVFEATGQIYPSDGDMWDRINHHCLENDLKCYVVRHRTCFHEEENH